MIWFDRNLSQMSGLLDSPHLEVRMAAGEVVALMLERGRQYDDDYEWEASEQLIDKLRQLATDSHKYRAKKDRKTQRSSFRDILKYVEVSGLLETDAKILGTIFWKDVLIIYIYPDKMSCYYKQQSLRRRILNSL